MVPPLSSHLTYRWYPRSRGVYAGPALADWLSSGSSPIARGLPDGARQETVCMRIIPARAGFTGRRARFFQADADHPRSRGVYTRHSYYVSIRAGSSPLARGLPRRGQLRQRQQGIIPARAGFTLLHHLRFRKGRDHPRSRGVYPRRSRQVLNSPGSSPLARGLPRPGGARRPAGGIIPARAGFTLAATDLRYPGPDHPRSRGVYSPATPLRWTSRGSSPLARGLRRPTRNSIRRREDHGRH